MTKNKSLTDFKNTRNSIYIILYSIHVIVFLDWQIILECSAFKAMVWIV